MGSWANAAICSGSDRYIELTPAIGDCYASSSTSSEDNIGNGTESWLSLGYTEIDDSGDAGTGYLSGTTTSGLSGSVTVSGDLSMYDSILIGFKLGNKHIDIVWGVFEIAGAGVYTWLSDTKNELSHVVLYGREGDTPEIPLPAAGFLLLGGLGGLAMMRRRAK